MIKIIEKLAVHVGVYAENLSTGKIYSYNNFDIFPAASVIKLPVLYELYLNYNKKLLNPDSAILYEKKDYVEDSPWFEKKEKGNYLLKDIAHSMITVSDNTATNLLIDLLGLKKINKTIEKLGMVQTALNRKMCDFETRNKGIENLTSPEDIAIFFKKLTGDYGNFFTPDKIKNFKMNVNYYPENSALEIIKILTEQKDLEKIPSVISGPGILIANKPGELPGIRNDTGLIITPENNYIICIFAEKVYDENEADALIAQLSGEIFNFLNT